MTCNEQFVLGVLSVPLAGLVGFILWHMFRFAVEYIIDTKYIQQRQRNDKDYNVATIAWAVADKVKLKYEMEHSIWGSKVVIKEEPKKKNG